ncbi:phage portal protein [Muricauda sp. MAR_2010_75]|uniref:phage portal protein n=1 Tax=Allomuricauda sp. MAR_2010_75 TaxID=1250232 RepID=UPI0005604DBB|nr:phage portal protein [Muricauda sp. MAR_2010_75]
MAFKDTFIGKFLFGTNNPNNDHINDQPSIEPHEHYGAVHEVYDGRIMPVRYGSFHGEKTPGELGDVYKLTPSYQLLRYRSYEAELTNDVVNIISGKFFKWVIGKGLKTQAEPNEKALSTENVPKVPEDFRDNVESRFDVYANSKMCDYKNEQTLHGLAIDAFKMAWHGDGLIVHRLEDNYPTIQLIDGEHVQNPPLIESNGYHKAAKEKGHEIRNGIEFDKKGRHVAYYVRTSKRDHGAMSNEFERIPAFGERTGRRMAMLFGLKKHRIDNDRYIPMTTAILEKLTKLDRYTEATVGTLEERAKIAFSIEHTKDSTGENPLLSAQRAAAGKGKNAAPETVGFELGEKTAQIVSATTGKQTFNMPVGAKLSALYSQNEVQYEPFWKAVFKTLCASSDVPPEVAMQEYNSNYSASRAAIGGWEYIVSFYRKLFTDVFYAPFYELWLHTEILKGNINAPGYIKNSTNFMVMGAYCKARFIGDKMPHIDPVKEVKAVAEMVDKRFMSSEEATEKLTGGDFYENQKKIEKENQHKPKEPKEENTEEEGSEGELKVVNGKD